MAANLYDLFLDDDERPRGGAAPRAAGGGLDAAAERYGVPLPLARALVGMESGGRDDAVSYKGARGRTQVMPGTMREMGYDPDRATPEEYIDAGMGYLRKQYDRFGRWDLALAAYHAGPGAIRDGQIPDTTDGLTRTPDYVRRIMGAAQMGDSSADTAPRRPRTALDLFLDDGPTPEDDRPQRAARAREAMANAPVGFAEEVGRGLRTGVERLGAGLSAGVGRDSSVVASDLADVAQVPRSAAQQQYEEQLKTATEGFDRAQGFAESTGAVIDIIKAVFGNPTQAARATAESLAASSPAFVGAMAGAGAGALAGPAGSVIGGLVGFLGGSLATNTQVEMASRLDEKLRERGVDTANVQQTIAALEQNPTIVSDARSEAIAAGLATTGVEATVDLATFGLARVTKPARSLIGTAVRATGAVGMQGVGEGLGAAAGDAAAGDPASPGSNIAEGLMGIIPGIPEAAGAVYAGRNLPFAKALRDIDSAQTIEEVVAAAATALGTQTVDDGLTPEQREERELRMGEARLRGLNLVDDAQALGPARAARDEANRAAGSEMLGDAQDLAEIQDNQRALREADARAAGSAMLDTAQEVAGLRRMNRDADARAAGASMVDDAQFVASVSGVPRSLIGGAMAAGEGTATLPRESTAVEGDGDWRAFAPESGSMGVPRADMPQIRPETHGSLVNFLKARGVESTLDEVPAGRLRPTQAEYSPAKVESAREAGAGDKRVLVSSDGYVVDGHHRWIGALMDEAPVKVIRFDAPARELLDLVREFPSAGQSDGGMPGTATAAPAQFDPQGLRPGTPEYEAAFQRWANARQDQRAAQGASDRRAENRAAVQQRNGWRRKLREWFLGAKDGDTIADTGTGQSYKVVEKTRRDGTKTKVLVAVDDNGNPLPDGRAATGIAQVGGRVDGLDDGTIDEDSGAAQPETDAQSLGTSLGKMLEDGDAQTSSAVRAAAQAKADDALRRLAELMGEGPTPPGGLVGQAMDAPVTEPEPKAKERTPAQIRAAKERREAFAKKNPFLMFLGKHGVALSQQRDITGEKGKLGNRTIPYGGPMFRKNGLNLDLLAQAALESGFLSPFDMVDPTDNGGERKLAEMIRRAFNGDRVLRPGEQIDELEREMRAAYDDFVETEAETQPTEAEADAPEVDDAAVALADAFDEDEVNALLAEVGYGAEDLDDAQLEALADEGLALLIAEADAEAAGGPVEAASPDAAPADAGDRPRGGDQGDAPRPQGLIEQAAADAPPADLQDSRQDGQDGQDGQGDFTLTGQTPDQVRAADDARRRDEAERARRDAAPSPDDFVLTGSDSPADQARARGQLELGEAPAPEGDLLGGAPQRPLTPPPKGGQVAERAAMVEKASALAKKHGLTEDEDELWAREWPELDSGIEMVVARDRDGRWGFKIETTGDHFDVAAYSTLALTEKIADDALAFLAGRAEEFAAPPPAPAAPTTAKEPTREGQGQEAAEAEVLRPSGGAERPRMKAPPKKGDRARGADNKVFTKQKADAARELLRRMLSGGTLNAGLDPEVVRAGIELAGFHIEAGARTFAAYARAMVADLGDAVRPYLKGWYLAVKNYPGFDAEGMDRAGAVEDADLDAALAEQQPTEPPAADSPLDDTRTGDWNGTSPFMNLQMFSKAEDAYVNAVVQAIHSGQPPLRTVNDLRRLWRETTGIEVNGRNQKRAEELAELAIVLYGRDRVEKGRALDAPPAVQRQAVFRSLVEAYEQRQPTLGTRTSTSVEQQAYSTPLPLAYLASELAGITQETSVYEPTAGNGMLLIGAAPENVIANELNGAREASLRIQDFAVVSNRDASTFVPRDQVDVVIANPPFGAVRDEDGQSRRFQIDVADADYSTTEIDHAIAFKALQAMKDDGRAVLIVGSVAKTARSEEARAEAYNGAAKRQFFYFLYRDYNVTQHFTVSGDLYRKQGAAWPVDVIVIEGRGRSERALPAVEPPRVYDSWDSLKGLLDEADRLDARRPTEDGRRAGDRARPDRQPDDRGVPGPAGDPGAGAGRRGGAPRGGRGGVRGDSRQGGLLPGDSGRSVRGGRDADPEQRQPAPGPSDAGRDAGRGGAGRDAPGAGRGPGAAGGQNAAGDRPAAPDRTPPRAADLGTNANQVGYTPTSKVGAIGTLMPVNMQQSVADALAALSERVGDIDAFVAKELGYERSALGRFFGAEQVDALALAIDSMNRDAGFVIGDQTGIGKGRVVAGVIRWALKNGKTPIFVTEKPNLYGDMYRDLTDIGVTDIRPVMTNQSEKIPLNEDGSVELRPMPRHNEALRTLADSGRLEDANIIFTTYSQMQFLKGAATVRNDFLARFAEGGVVIFDESHNAGGQEASSRNKKKGEDEAKKDGRAGFARRIAGSASAVFYSSATWAKRPEVMDLYFKTDMALAVGGQAAKLPGAIQAGGVPLQQVVAAMLAKSGQYIRRERSFNGVEYNTTETAVDHDAAEAISRVMLGVAKFDQLKQAAVKALAKEMRAEAKKLEGGDVSIGQAGATSTNFTSIMHNLIDQMLLSLKVDAAVDIAIGELKAGRKPVLTVANTMGSFIEQYVSDMGLQPGDSLALSFRSLLLRYLQRSRFVTIKDPGSKVPTRRELTDRELGPQAVAAFKAVEAMIENARGLDTAPISPIDYIHHRLRKAGYRTGEITGRTHIINYSAAQGAAYETRKAADVSIRGRRKTISGFNGGDIDVIVLNQAGSTGLSLHASEKFKDQRPRSMLIVQPERNIDTHMQMLGRVHRTGQVVLPRYFQLVADIPAEKRPAAVLAKKMASLNANTTANRKSAVTSESVVDFMNDYGDEVAAQLMTDLPDVHRKLGSPLKSDGDELSRENAIARVTGRIPLLPLREQEELYALIESGYTEMVERANALGENMLEAQTLELDARTVTRQSVFEGRGDSPFAAGAFAEVVDVKRLGKPYSSEQARALMVSNLRAAGAPIDENAQFGAILAAGLSVRDRMLADVYSKARAYEAEMTSGVEDPEDLRAIEGRLNGARNRWELLARDLRIGASYRLQLPGGANVMGYVAAVKKKEGVKNPVAAGAWQIQFALADAARTITVPMSKIAAPGEDSDGKIGYELRDRDPITGQTVAEGMDAGQSASREQRVMMTGNLLAAFGKLPRGQIVNYTDDQGAIRQGILMPRGFDMKKVAGELPLTFPSVESIRTFLDGRPQQHAVQTADELARLVRAGYGYMLRVPKAKSVGGTYFLDAQLRGLSKDRDFVSRGDSMVANFEQGDLEAVVKRLEAISGDRLQTSTFRPEAERAGAKSALGGDRPAMSRRAPEASVSVRRGMAVGGMPIKRLTTIVNGIRSRWLNAPDIEVVASAADLPDRVQAEIGRQEAGGAQAAPQGVYWNGTVYLVADQLPTEGAVVETLLHETLGHYGLRGVFGARLNPFLDRLALARPAQMREKARDYGLSLANVEERRAVAEELLAEIAQYEPNLTIIDRLIVAVRDWLRMIGLELEWSDADVIAKAILPARRFVEGASRSNRSDPQPTTMQGSGERAFRDAENLADIVQGASFREQGLRGLEVPQQRVVLAIVVGAIRDAEVRRRVVELVPVDVVNDLAGRQGAPEALLGQPPVLKNLAAINSQDSIPVRVDAADALVRAVARIAAERLGASDERAFPLDLDAAMGATEADAATSGLTEAGIGAERPGAGARSGRAARERNAAAGTGKIDGTQDAAPVSGVERDASGVTALGASPILATSDAPAAARGARLSTLLRRFGQQPESAQEAARWLSDGWRVFVAHEMDEDPVEVTSVERLLDYTYAEDQMIGLPPGAGGTAPANPSSPADPVRALIDGMRFATGSGQARAAADAFLGRTLVNADSGIAATVSRAALDKMLSKGVVDGSVSPQAHMRAVANLDHLFALALRRLSRPGKKAADGENVKAIHHFDAPLPFDGRVLRVKIMAKEFAAAEQGTRLYLVQAVEVVDAGVVGGDPVVSGQSRSGQQTASPPPPGVERRFAELADEVKRQAERPAMARAPGRRTWDTPEASKLDDFLYTLQDKQIDLRRVVQAIKAKVGQIADRWNPYLQEELYHGRTAKRVKDFLDFELRPLLTDMQMRGVALPEFEKFLHARHAEERNVQIAKINPKMPDGGSGMTTADARAYLAGLDPAKRRAYEALAAKVDAITKGTRDGLVADGLEKQDSIDRWTKAYSNYVPLMREEVEETGAGTGMGFSVRGPASRRAMGSDKGVVDILANLAMQRERAIIRAEKNRVAKALYGLAVKNPNTEFWKPVNPRLFPAWSAKQKQKLEAELLSMGLDPVDAAGLVREPVQRYVDPRDGLVHERVNPALRGRDNVLSLRVNGEDRFLFFNATDERAARMAHSLKNLDVDQLGRVLSASAVASRWFASVNTQYNPIFGVVNLTRDVQSALFNLSTTPIAGKQAAVLGHTVSALRGIYADIRAHRAGKAPSSTWAQLWEEFQREGGQTGFRDMWATAGDRTKALESEIRQIGEGKARGAGRAIFAWLSDYNETLENATRLAAYKVALDAGQSKQQAASIAKNLTVNFNRKGQITQQAGALYAFFNASVQGTARLAETLAGPMGRKIIAGGLILGVAQAMLLAAAGFDDDDPPEFVRERNLVIPIGGQQYVTIPMPLGLHVLPGFSRITTEWVLSGFRKPTDRLAAIVSMLAETFNPIGNAGLSLQTITPTVVDPLAALAENRDFTGRPIARENINTMQPKPGFERTRDSASWAAKQLAYWLNAASGGTDFTPGLLSPTPDQIDYLVGQVTGGVGRELLKAQQTAGGLASGEEIAPYKMPLVGRFYGDASSGASESARFFDNLKTVYQAKAEMDGRRRAGESVAAYMREHPESRLVTAASQVDRDLDEMKKERREAARRGATAEQLRRLDDRMKARMAAFNRRVEALQQ